jgi:hypothetical protein
MYRTLDDSRKLLCNYVLDNFYQLTTPEEWSFKKRNGFINIEYKGTLVAYFDLSSLLVITRSRGEALITIFNIPKFHYILMGDASRDVELQHYVGSILTCLPIVNEEEYSYVDKTYVRLHEPFKWYISKYIIPCVKIKGLILDEFPSDDYIKHLFEEKPELDYVWVKKDYYIEYTRNSPPLPFDPLLRIASLHYREGKDYGLIPRYHMFECRVKSANKR